MAERWRAACGFPARDVGGQRAAQLSRGSGGRPKGLRHNSPGPPKGGHYEQRTDRTKDDEVTAPWAEAAAAGPWAAALALAQAAWAAPAVAPSAAAEGDSGNPPAWASSPCPSSPGTAADPLR